MLPYTCLSCSCIWSYFRPFPKRFRCDWLTSQARYVRVHFTRRAMHASCESPWHSLAKRHLLGACFPRMAPFRSMLLTLRGGPESLAPRAHRIPVYPMVFSTFLYRAFTAHFHPNICLIHAPAHPHWPCAPVKRFFQQGALFDHPAVDGGVIQLDPSFCHEFFDVARAQRVRQIPPDAHENDLFGEMRPLETDHRRSPVRGLGWGMRESIPQTVGKWNLRQSPFLCPRRVLRFSACQRPPRRRCSAVGLTV